MAEASPESDDAPDFLGGRVPLVIAACGHRDARDEPLEAGGRRPSEAAREVLRAYLVRYPSTPLLLLSGLAEGADTWVAEAALELAETPVGKGAGGRPRIALVAALPMPLEAAAADFAGAGHATRVRSLLARAVRVLELPVPSGADAAALARDPARRGEQYARLAALLSTRAHVLLALWDGLPQTPGTLGGTAETVAWFLGGPPRSRAPSPVESDPLRVPDGLRLEHVLVRRNARDRVGGLRSGDREAGAEDVFRQFEEFNRDVAAGGVPADAEDSRGARAEGAGPILRTRVAANALALRSRRRRTVGAGVLAALAGGALVAASLFGHAFPSRWPLLLAYLAAFVLSVGVVLATRRLRVEPKYLVYRSLAEALRIQGWWAAAGIEDDVGEHYQPLYRGAVAWVRHSLQGLHLLQPAPPRVAPAAAARGALDGWIAQQTRFFEERIERVRARSAVLTWAFRALLGAGFVCGAALAGLVARDPDTMHHEGGWIFATMIVLVGTAALARAWTVTMGYEALHRRYEAALDLYRRAQREIERLLESGDPADLGRVEEVLRSLGRAAVEENTAWLLAFRDRPLEIHAGG